MTGARLAKALVTGFALAIAAGAAHAEDAPGDTLLRRFLGGLSDSTDAYFGMSAAKPDTAGLDSALAYRLTHSEPRPRLRLMPDLFPWVGFNRVDGGVMGGGLAFGRRSRIGRLSGRAAWANGPNVVLGEGVYEKAFLRDESSWTLRLGAGRLTDGMDRDFGELRLAQVRALLSGADTKRYFRREGFRARFGRETPIWRAGVEYRDELESPLPVTATWNLMNATPEVVDNLPAVRGRARELEWSSTAGFGRLPISGEVDYAISGNAIGSDFEYRRLRLAFAGDLAVGRWLAVVPQLSWGRVTGQTLPQNSFYLGGARTLRHLKGSSLGGSRMALARLDLIGVPDLLALAHIPHPDALPLQGAVFAGAGATWGRDPYGGPGSPEDAWPGSELWKSELGVSVLYRPGIPDPNGFLRFSYAWPLGPSDQSGRFTITFARGLDLLRPLE